MRYLILCLALVQLAWTQQLNGTYMNIDYPGLSTGCKTALNSSVACPLFLARRAGSDAKLDQDSVNALCTNNCLTSLQNVRNRIVGACTASTDKITIGSLKQPASFIVDNYIYAYTLSCRKDAQTGQFCDPILFQWSQKVFGANETCSDCWLGGQALQLNNPLGYDADLASNFASLTSSCSAIGKYTYTVPASTSTVDATPTSTPLPSASPVCSGSYKLTPADTDCNAVAKTLGVSTYDLLIANNIDVYCQSFWSTAQNGTTLCVPQKCTTYTWQAEDTCESVLINRPTISRAQFLAWNPNINSLCGNVGKFLGYQVCISPPGGFVNATAPPTGPGPSATAPVPKPTNGIETSNKPCGQWYTIAPDDTCSVVSLANGITLADLYFLNPGLNTNCTNLLLGLAYCVAPVGAINTYSGYPTSSNSGAWATISVPLATFPPVNTAITTRTGDPGYKATTSLMPTASGTVSGCLTYRNFFPNNTALNDCGYVAYAYDITVATLRQWNPSLGTTGACSLKAGLSYCVERTTTVVPPKPAYCNDDLNPTEPGTAADCNCFTQVMGRQNASGFTCNSLVSSLPITIAQLLGWNTWLGTSTANADCTRALYANLAAYGRRSVCIGTGVVGGTTTTRPTSSSTTSKPPSSTTTSRTTSTSTTKASSTTTTRASSSSTTKASLTSSGPPVPTQTGFIPGCRQFYTVQSGDGCWSIQQQFAITFDQFLAWNPSVGSNCENLWLGYAYCVKGPA